jgi:hypothetical protein
MILTPFYLSLGSRADPYFGEQLPLRFTYGTHIRGVFAEANVAALFAVPQRFLDPGFVGSDLDCLFGSFFGTFFRRRRSAVLGSPLLFFRPALWYGLDGGFAFKHIFSHVQGAVTATELFDIWISVVARAEDVSVQFEVARGHSAGTGGIPITFFVPLQAF